MNEPYFRDYHLFLDQQPDVGGTARLAEHAEHWAASTHKNLLLETMTAEGNVGRGAETRGADVRRGLYDQGPIFGELLAGTVVQVCHRNDPCLSIEISIGAPR